jgi:peptidoglycan/xylan/chitin deacetylase (PgdA/CDA1 family)
VNLALSYVLWKGRTAVLHGAGIPGLGSDDYPLETPAQRTAVIARINAHTNAEALSATAKDEVVRALGRQLGVDYDAMTQARILTLMNPKEVTSMASQGVDFQLHTHRHRTPRDAARFLEEVQQNSWRIEGMTGVRPTHFCYPSGIHYPEYLPVLAGEGVVSATTTKPGIADASDNPLLLPRFVDTNRITDLTFESWLHGFAPWLRRMA